MAEENNSSSVGRLAERVGCVAAEVERALAAPLALPGDLGSHRRWITTGVGASEGPARLLAALLRADGRVADFAPISSFADGAPAADACVVVSQGLSPNARLPLARAAAYARMILVTAHDADHAGVAIVRHGPASEDGLLLRVVGPAAANATVVRLAKAITRETNGNGASHSPPDVGGALATARQRALDALGDHEPASMFELAGLVASGDDTTLCDGLRHKLLEGLGRTHPPIWDVCALVHGPLQSFYERDATLLSIEREPSRGDLHERLARVLLPRHRVVRLRSKLPGALAVLDFDLQLNHLLVEALRARPRDLAEWPGKGCDGALYELGSPRI
ncbi:MAG TPA: hypothetical protein VGH28_04660 [Polyangiaceae bacterium]|jgi:creatinine amidohydrolase